MNSIYTKAIAAFFGAGVPGGLAQLILYWIGAIPLPPEVLQSIVTGIVLGAVAAATVFLSPPNTITTPQVVASAKAGELQTALAGTKGEADATAVAEAITALPVKTNLIAEGAPVEILKPAPVPGGDGKGHSSLDTPKRRVAPKKGK